MTTVAGPIGGRVPWWRLAWTAWRQHRMGLITLGVLFGAFGFHVFTQGLHTHQTYQLLRQHRCFSAPQGGACGRWLSALYPEEIATWQFLAPALTGMFLGAPLLAGEYTAGTWKFAWTQGTGRARWLLGRLIPMAIMVTAAGLVLGGLTYWSMQPYFRLGWQNRWQSSYFNTAALAMPGYLLLALALGVLIGAVIRRTVPAMAVTAAAITALVLTAHLWLHDLLLRIIPGSARPPMPWVVHSAERYWLFQSVAGLLLLVLAAALIAITTWITHRHPS